MDSIRLSVNISIYTNTIASNKKEDPIGFTCPGFDLSPVWGLTGLRLIGHHGSHSLVKNHVDGSIRVTPSITVLG